MKSSLASALSGFSRGRLHRPTVAVLSLCKNPSLFRGRAVDKSVFQSRSRPRKPWPLGVFEAALETGQVSRYAGSIMICYAGGCRDEDLAARSE